ncbi:MAG: Rieske (2Fe-2S) protein [Candidatus Bathyarchaeia archaeon]|jgi:3-phenylpropionate/trans-cinnamate dioxygenase ferredoxin subunit
MSNGFVWVISVNDLAENQIKQVSVVGRKILLIKREGQVYAVASHCPHKGYDLSKGFLKDNLLVCPCHDWSFDIRTGEYQTNKAIKLLTFECKIEEDNVYVKPFNDFY